MKAMRKSGVEKFANTIRHFGCNDVYIEKGFYPYEYMTDELKLDDNELQLKSTFYNCLVGKEFDDEHYEHAKRLWMMHVIMTLCNWHHFYLRLVVLLLADVSQVFRCTMIGSHKLDCLHCPGLPSMMLQLILKVAEVELELINDPNIYLMIECGIHGGLSNVVQCHPIATSF